MLSPTVFWQRTADPASDLVLRFAAEELASYCERLTRASYRVESGLVPERDGSGIWVGLAGRLAQPPGMEPLRPAPWDDGYVIWPDGPSLYIVGTNPRSALFGVYHWLESQGVRYVRPGREGEIVPQRDHLDLPDAPLVEAAAHRHRGICIEGAPSLEHCLGMVDWCAKRRMNTVFLQFFSSRYFYQKWYGREYNPQFADHDVSDLEARELDSRVTMEMKRRGMVYHQVGHGWTAQALGLPRSGWVQAGEDVPEDRRRWLAESDGVRKLHQGIPINTELCYSYAPAFDAFVENVVAYVEEHPELDVVHVWLSDAPNNKCQCSDCRKLTVSDWYAKIINALSERLHKWAPGKRFVFLSYMELLWPPEAVEIDETYGNTILMYAPITRCYGHGLFDPGCDDGQSYPRPELGAFAHPRSNAFFVRSLAGWRQAFGGDAFDFDYHLRWAVWQHLTDTVVARTVHADLQELKAHGLDGILSCQTFRTFFPSGLGMAVLAEALWDPGRPLEEIGSRYLESACGPVAAEVSRYLDDLERCLDPGDGHWRSGTWRSMRIARPEELLAFAKEALPRLEALKRKVKHSLHARTLDILGFHAQYLALLAQACLAPSDGIEAALAEVERFLRDGEPEVHDICDIDTILTFVVERLRQTLLSS